MTYRDRSDRFDSDHSGRLTVTWRNCKGLMGRGGRGGGYDRKGKSCADGGWIPSHDNSREFLIMMMLMAVCRVVITIVVTA